MRPIILVQMLRRLLLKRVQIMLRLAPVVPGHIAYEHGFLLALGLAFLDDGHYVAELALPATGWEDYVAVGRAVFAVCVAGGFAPFSALTGWGVECLGCGAFGCFLGFGAGGWGAANGVVVGLEDCWGGCAVAYALVCRNAAEG
jgi:hypothetical protein